MNDRLLELRKALGLSQEQMGKELGVTRSSISNMETGRFSMTDTMVKLICREFGVSEEWLRNGEGLMFEVPASESQELMEITAQIATDFKDPQKVKLMLMIAELLQTLTPEQGKIIEKYVKSAAETCGEDN